MARSSSLMISCAVAVGAVVSMASLGLSFVGTPATAGLRAGQRESSVEMQFFGGSSSPAPSRPSSPAGGDWRARARADLYSQSGVYVVSFSILFLCLCVLSGNTGPGYFGGFFDYKL
ncbi:unnamed protein product [Prorocentrum cordatum]|uniref:Uncharacterized protein n=1 Tax=Prorocentrum cordatum TaxID=2364126 RepID=A0ABN9W1Z7_9DINO|nr:unnamed protein product [Polarella glacialis]CAK0880036.1 unnamed protein product [Polarella glacialis]CAK0880038.1 unnamed protein product [Polarella glacialis]